MIKETITCDRCHVERTWRNTPNWTEVAIRLLGSESVSWHQFCPDCAKYIEIGPSGNWRVRGAHYEGAA